LLAALTAYIVIGLVYSTWWTVSMELGRTPGGDIPPPRSTPTAFLVWFIVPAALWPAALVGFHDVPEALVASVYLATVGPFYLTARRRPPRDA